MSWEISCQNLMKKKQFQKNSSNRLSHFCSKGCKRMVGLSSYLYGPREDKPAECVGRCHPRTFCRTIQCQSNPPTPAYTHGRGGAWDHLWCGPGLCRVSFGAGVAKTIEPQPCYCQMKCPWLLWRHSFAQETMSTACLAKPFHVFAFASL